MHGAMVMRDVLEKYHAISLGGNRLYPRTKQYADAIIGYCQRKMGLNHAVMLRDKKSVIKERISM